MPGVGRRESSLVIEPGCVDSRVSRSSPRRLLWIFLIEERFRNEAAEHLYFHAWTSEYMMQTVSVGDLRVEPFKSLWYNHIQPPLFDAIRAAFAAVHPNAHGEALMRRVDGKLYDAWMFVYAATAVLVFSWFEQGTRRSPGGDRRRHLPSPSRADLLRDVPRQHAPLRRP